MYVATARTQRGALNDCYLFGEANIAENFLSLEDG